MTEIRPSSNTHRPPDPSAVFASAARTFRSEDLFQGAREILIQHGTEVYRLRITRAGKLILNK